MGQTKIEYVDLTINPIVGCSHCSPGCDNCYAERFAARLAKNPKTAAKYAGVVDENGKWTGRLSRCDLTCFDRLPKTPKRIFVGSMTDIFHGNANTLATVSLLDKISAYPSHTFMFLTKRANNMQYVMDFFYTRGRVLSVLPNVWLGVTVCNQEEANAKIPPLLQTPAAKRFVSVEPMLGPVEIGKYLYGSYECALSCGTRLSWDILPEKRCTKCGFTGPDDYETWGDGDYEICPECPEASEVESVCPNCGTYMVQGHPDTRCIDWVIAGPETGPGARLAQEEWFRSLRDQCTMGYNNTPFFLKKNADGTRLLDGKEWNEVPS